MSSKNIFGGVMFGFILLAGGAAGLWWNEGNYVKEDKKIGEGKKVVVPIATTTVESQNEGKLVFVNGKITTEEVLKDPIFGVDKKLVKLRRKTEVYQYKETKKGRNDDIEYQEVWEEKLIDSRKFVNEVKKNPQVNKYPSAKWEASRVKLGEFDMNPHLISQINAWDDLELPGGQMIVNRDTFMVIDNVVYHSKTPDFPKIGDTRTTLSVVYPNKEVSLAAQQHGSSFVPYQTKNGRKIELLKMGNYSPEGFFQAMEESNTAMNWFFRVFGFFGLFFGFKMLLSPLVSVGRIVPFLGRIVGMGTSLVSGLLAGAIGFVIASISWIFYRPLIGFGLLAIGVGLFVYLKMKNGKEVKAAG